MTFARDPISEQFDGAAAAHLRRAFNRRGEWVPAFVANPSPEWLAWALANGWGRLRGPDDAPGGRARTRWCRAYVRACHNLHRKYMTSHGLDLGEPPRVWGVRPPWALDFRVASRLVEVPQQAGGLVARRVDLRLLTQAEARRFAARIPQGSRERWITDAGPGPRYANWTYHA
jgi:hypothetical protein